jgi:hypothetical protein
VSSLRLDYGVVMFDVASLIDDAVHEVLKFKNLLKVDCNWNSKNLHPLAQDSLVQLIATSDSVRFSQLTMSVAHRNDTS